MNLYQPRVHVATEYYLQRSSVREINILAFPIRYQKRYISPHFTRK